MSGEELREVVYGEARPTFDAKAAGARCDICPIRVPNPVGPAPARKKVRLVIVGEGPGRMEESVGKPFIGPSGRLLDHVLMENSIDRSEAHVTNAMLCLEGQVLVRMADGRNLRINEIVKKEIRDEVMTVEKDGSIGRRPIIGWYRSPRAGRRILKVTHAFSKGNPNGTSRVLMTEDHQVLTEYGWRPAKEVGGVRIATGDRAPIGTTREIAIGTLLGDATIPRTRRYLQLSHAEDQCEYAEAKARAFEASVWTSPPRKGWQRKYGFHSYASGFFGEMRAQFYPRGKKRIPTDVADNLSDLSLAIWFMDDGYMRVRANGHASAEICAAAFPRKDVARVVRRLRARGFDCKIGPSTRPTRIHFSWKGAHTLSDRIARFVPPQMQYKLIPTHRGQFDPRTFDPHHGPFYAEAIVREVSPAKNTQTVYCVDVAVTHNFITTTAVVHNCRKESDDQIPGMVYACSRRLFRELKALPESAPIVTLGKFSTTALLPTKGIIKSRGFIWQIPPKLSIAEKKKLRRERIKAREKEKLTTVYNTTLKLRRSMLARRIVFPILHPATILRSEIEWPLLQTDFERVAKFLRLQKLGKKLALEDEKPFVIVSKTRELRKLLHRFEKRDVLVDIETDGPDPLSAKMLCVGIGTPKLTVVCYPWRRQMGLVLQELFDGGAKLVGHNVITFDCLVLERYGVSVGILDKASECDRVEDTLVAHHSFASHLLKSLAHVASVFCDARPWKIIAKGGDGKSEKGALPHQLSPEELTRYNAADVSLNTLAWARMQSDLRDELPVYRVTKRLSGLCARMRWRGFAFDMKFAKELSRKLLARKQNLLWEMRDLIGDPDFRPSRAFDLRAVLFGQLKVPLIYPTKTGLPATSRMVLEQLRHGDDMAGQLSDLILRWRDAQKTLSTYLSVDVKEGRVHGDWRIGPVSGRLACRMMTLPRFSKSKEDTTWVKKGEVDITDQVRACYIAPPKRVLIYYDLSQAEMRFAANLSGDPTFIAACKGDVHAGNAAVLFPAQAKMGFFATDAEAKDGKGKPYRDIAKNAGFAVTYLAEADTVYVFLNAHGFPVSLIEVETMLGRLRIAYKGYFDYVAQNVAFVQKNGWLRSAASGRIRYFGHTPKPTEVANFPVQTGIADMMNVRLLDVERQLPDSAFVIAQIHDAAIIEADEGDVDKVKKLIHEIYDPPICLPDRAPFYVPIDLKCKMRWSELG